MKVSITDKIRIDDSTTKEITDDGFLRGQVVLTKQGIFKYLPEELGVKSNKKILSVFRPQSVIDNDITKRSAALKPITIDHPIENVTPDNIKNFSVGNIGDNIVYDDGYLKSSFIITDKKAIDMVSNNSPQVSLGYTADMREAQGECDGQHYDYEFFGDMIINHLAIVDEGRAGPSVKIQDKSITGKLIMSIKDKIKSALNINDADVDMDALMEKMASQVMPKLEAMLADDAFQQKMAEKMAEMLMGQDSEGEGELQAENSDQEPVENEADKENQDESPDDMQKNNMEMDSAANINKIIKSAVTSEVSKLTKATAFIDSVKTNFDINLPEKATCKDAAISALKKLGVADSEIKGKSFDYLSGRLESLKSLRDQASAGQHAFSVSNIADQNDFGKVDRHQLKKMNKGS